MCFLDSQFLCFACCTIFLRKLHLKIICQLFFNKDDIRLELFSLSAYKFRVAQWHRNKVKNN